MSHSFPETQRTYASHLIHEIHERIASQKGIATHRHHASQILIETHI